jgi:hypothetical protein
MFQKSVLKINFIITDKEISKIFYKLYDLTDEGIKIVENKC